MTVSNDTVANNTVANNTANDRTPRHTHLVEAGVRTVEEQLAAEDAYDRLLADTRREHLQLLAARPGRKLSPSHLREFDRALLFWEAVEALALEKGKDLWHTDYLDAAEKAGVLDLVYYDEELGGRLAVNVPRPGELLQKWGVPPAQSDDWECGYCRETNTPDLWVCGFCGGQ